MRARIYLEHTGRLIVGLFCEENLFGRGHQAGSRGRRQRLSSFCGRISTFSGADLAHEGGVCMLLGDMPSKRCESRAEAQNTTTNTHMMKKHASEERFLSGLSVAVTSAAT